MATTRAGKMTKQLQKSGDYSTNVQTDTVHITYGISYAEARDIALDVFKANFLTLSKDAAIVAQTRAEEITTAFLAKLQAENSPGLENARDPDFQYALYTVQKEYARTGDKELGDLLVDLLVDRSKYDTRSLLQIVLNESLSVAPKLTEDQLAALSIVFLIKHTIHNNINSLEGLSTYLDNFILPFIMGLSKSDSCYQHLEYAGCGSINRPTVRVTGVGLETYFRNQYSEIFSKGFEQEALRNRQINLAFDNEIFIECLQNPEKKQIDAMNEETLQIRAKELNINEQEIAKLIELNNSCLMSPAEVRQYLHDLRPYMQTVCDVWMQSYMRNFSLTSVGIAIAHANVKRKLGEFTNLAIWIK